MEENNRKTWVRRGIYLLLAAFCLAFGVTLKNKFCLGDVILNAMNLPAWSRGTQGFHYPAIPALAGTLIFFCLFAATTQKPKRTILYLYLGTVLVMRVLSSLI